MKTNLPTTLLGLMIPVLIIFSSLFLSNCKGKSDIINITDSVENCMPPYVVYFYPEAEHRTRKLEYTWNFGDGATSHEQEPVHTYTDYGIYTVTLEVRQNKAYDKFSYDLNLTKEATAPFAEWDFASRADSLWAPAYVEFQNYSEHSTTFLWEFGDNETSTAESPIHIYETAGTYTTVLNAICQKDTAKLALDMVIKPAPSEIIIDEITIWMPSDYIGKDIWVSVWYGGNHEFDTSVATAVTSFPITFVTTRPLAFFNGGWGPDLLEFELWSSISGIPPEKIFDRESISIQNSYYPDFIGQEDGYGFAYEALLQYRQYIQP